MTDRELLELAAKAAGIHAVAASTFGDSDVVEECRLGLWNRESGGVWNPLTDDGDALRLAVKLKLKIAHHAWRDEVTVFRTGDSLWTACEYADGNHYSATRRAIVRAAAAIAEKP